MTNVSLFEQLSKTLKPENQQMETIATVMESAMTTLHSIVKQSYYVEEAINKGEYVAVKFCKDGDESQPDEEIAWMKCRIDMDTLREYVEYWGMNEVTNDFIRAGEHCQETYTMDFDHYMEEYENRERACAEWLRDNRGMEVAR